VATPELVIFDCDGVLVDSERIGVRIDVEILAEFGLPLSEEQVIERFVGRSQRVMLDAIEAHRGRALPDRWEERYRPRYIEAFERELTTVDGIEEALDRIRQQTCVASSSSHESLRHVLGLTGLYDRFAGRIFSASEVTEGKPAPDLFLHAAQRMGVSPANCVVVEDSSYGVQAGRAANMDVLAYAGGLTRAPALEGPRTVVFDDMRELPELLAAREGG
jgi:HAD superfamily hydrolase (TIGR01509 family)